MANHLVSVMSGVTCDFAHRAQGKIAQWYGSQRKACRTFECKCSAVVVVT